MDTRSRREGCRYSRAMVALDALEVLRNGFRVWNSWVGSRRRDDPHWRADLTYADLTGADLAGADLAGGNLARASLARASLAGAHLFGADLAGADLAGADLTGAQLIGASLARANLAGADLTDADLTHADLTDADLTAANLSRATVTRATFNSEAVSVQGVRLGLLLGSASPATPRASDRISPGVIRLTIPMPREAEISQVNRVLDAVGVLASLAVTVDARIIPSEPTTGGGVAVLTGSPRPPTTIQLSKLHYGSPLILEIVEYLVAGGMGAVGTAAVRRAIKGPGESRVWDLLLTLARREERDPWLETRVERRKKERDSEKSDAAESRARSARAENEIAKLSLGPQDPEEASEAVQQANINPDARQSIEENVRALEPITERGIVVEMAEDDAESA